MVYAKLKDIKKVNGVKYYKLKELTGERKTGEYTENQVIEALKSGVIYIEYLKVTPLTNRLIVDEEFWDNKKPKKPTKAEKIKKLKSKVASLEKQLEKADSIDKQHSLQDKIIVARRELCKLQGIETSTNSNIYTKVHKARKNSKVTKIS